MNKHCGFCGSELQGTINKNRKYCNHICRGRSRRANERTRGTNKVSCSNCQKIFRTYHNNKKFCSSTCRKSYKGDRNNIPFNVEKIVLNKNCLECDLLFDTHHQSQIYCSIECQKRYRDRLKTNARRKHYVAGDSNITLPKLIKRDANVCHLCHGECDSNDFYIIANGTIICGNRYPSIDHVVPLSAGGEHKWSNVKLAHRTCNTKKGSQIIQAPRSEKNRSKIS